MGAVGGRKKRPFQNVLVLMKLLKTSQHRDGRWRVLQEPCTSHPGDQGTGASGRGMYILINIKPFYKCSTLSVLNSLSPSFFSSAYNVGLKETMGK